MKTLISTLFAALFVLAVASVASAGDITSFTSLSALDSSGVSVIAVHSPSMPLTISASENIYLDSNRVWSVSEVKNIGASRSEMAGKSMDKSSLYCFDSNSKFCARAN
jgi:hypothetical protein